MREHTKPTAQKLKTYSEGPASYPCRALQWTAEPEGEIRPFGNKILWLDFNINAGCDGAFGFTR